jgi:phosphoribosyl 1,2-cyclic phosphate phosphodiesterase
MPIYALERVIKDINIKFGYIFNGKPYPGLPKIICKEILPNQEISITPNLKIEVLEVMHGNLPILGFRIDDFAYITDASFLNEVTMTSLQNLEVLVINALQYRKHYSHYTLGECLNVVNRLKPKMTYLTHMSHELGEHETLCKKLPSDIRPAFDGMVLEF